MPNDFDKLSNGHLKWERDREHSVREAREQLAHEHRKHLEKSGKHISHTKARQFIDKLADRADKDK